MQKLQTNMLNPDSIQNTTHHPHRTTIAGAHLLTGRNQFGYKKGASEMDAVQNRTIHTRRRTRSPNTSHGLIQSIWGDKQNTTMDNAIQERASARNDNHDQAGTPKHNPMCKTPMRIRETGGNPCRFSQRSATSALLFIVYLDDMMEDHTSLNHKAQLHTRMTLRNTRTLKRKNSWKKSRQAKT